MAFIILLIMIAVPIGEIAVFIQAGEQFGLWPTLAAVILTAIAGTALLRRQGFDTLRRIQQSADRGEMPVRELFDGFCLLIAGALLLTPGFITDGVGFALFLPPFRRLLGGWALTYFMRNATVHTMHSGSRHRRPNERDGRRAPGGGPIIDGDFEDVSEGPAGGADKTPPKLPREPSGEADDKR